MEKVQGYLPFMGRVLLAQIFILSGLGKIADWSGTASLMAAKGLPAVPFLLTAAIVFEVVGGLIVLTGYRARVGALALILFLVPATLVFHNFWTYDGAERQMQMIHFMKNLAILGGLSLLGAFGSGPVRAQSRWDEENRRKMVA